MTTHHMHLQNRFFGYIKDGTKRIELRLNDEKRRNVRLDDEIVFTNDLGNEITVKVIGLLHYDNFENLCRDFPIEMLTDKSMTKNELCDGLQKIYPPEKQTQFGVLGIRLELK